MNDNTQCEFYISFVRLLHQFFEQPGSQRIKIFWMGLPSGDDCYALQVMVSWRINLGDKKIKGCTGDEIWNPVNFPSEFWGCSNNQELTIKMNNILQEHSVYSSNNQNLKSIWGVTFIKENWKETIISVIGPNALSAFNAEFLNNEIISNLDNCDYIDNDVSDFKL